MFGLILPSRPVLAPPTTALSQTQYAFNFPASPPFNHVVVFLLPGETLPAGTAATIHIRIPPAGEFRPLGAISNDKQNAMFKIGGGRGGGAEAPAADGMTGIKEEMMVDDATLQPVTDTAGEVGGESVVLGLSIEPVDSVQAQLQNLRAGGANPAQVSFQQATGQQQEPQNQLMPYSAQSVQRAKLDTGQVKVLAQRIIKDAFDFLGGFAQGPPGNEVVPLKGFQEWWGKFDKKVELDGEWLEKKIMQD
ncbi:MAG: hypothetical protein M1831_000579 [Alyxoria varia]|nr:MAG: hypothetical protein M1831_000579 [Alyxoria varia]